MKKILIVIVLTFVFGCGNEESNYEILVVADSKLSDNETDSMPLEIKTFINPSECQNSSTVYIPKLKVLRKDLSKDNIHEIEVPSTPDNKLRKKLGSYTYVDLKNDLAEFLPNMEAGKFLTKDGDANAEEDIKYDPKNTMVFSLSESMDVSKVKAKIDSTACEVEKGFNKKIIVILNNQSEVTTINGSNANKSPKAKNDNRQSPIEDPCQQNTVEGGFDLKEAISEIIDTTKKPSERDRIAKETWKKYFDKNAAITMYLKPNQTSPEGFWESGEGSIYFVDRLAFMSSIIEVNITRIEYHRDTKKISGITVVECHNANQAL